MPAQIGIHVDARHIPFSFNGVMWSISHRFNLFVFFEILLMASYVLLDKGSHDFNLAYTMSLSIFCPILNWPWYDLWQCRQSTDVSRLLPTLDADQHKLAVPYSYLLYLVLKLPCYRLATKNLCRCKYARCSNFYPKVGIYAILRVNGTVFNDVRKSLKVGSFQLV